MKFHFSPKGNRKLLWRESQLELQSQGLMPSTRTGRFPITRCTTTSWTAFGTRGRTPSRSTPSLVRSSPSRCSTERRRELMPWRLKLEMVPHLQNQIVEEDQIQFPSSSELELPTRMIILLISTRVSMKPRLMRMKTSNILFSLTQPTIRMNPQEFVMKSPEEISVELLQ